jgi:hypothetical protein
MVEKGAEAGGKAPPPRKRVGWRHGQAGVLSGACAERGVTVAQAAPPEAGMHQRTDTQPVRMQQGGLGPLLPSASAVRAGQGRACNRAVRPGKMFCVAKDL